MKVARKPIIFTLLFMLTWSSWAGATAPCSQNSPSSSDPMTVIDAHANHGDVHQHSQDSTENSQRGAGHHHAGQADDSAPVDCPCCDDCATMCVLSGCNPATVASDAFALSYNGKSPNLSLADVYRVGPIYPSLFRPPISNA